ncbi:deleted in azoospermia-like isoform X2 [Syngnathoides biaculeatus]|uniref:deleted in azoospermia-like isoform X2 n=1 Tax=Syngnathoides biaculeatus TaxID=300417 RepID=UPI002ADD91F2|nr:deleted in azoospermia-like isoform X2 [Syngnathoides biaculeatus]
MGSRQDSLSPQLSNGYVLPQGRVCPNAIFVGGIDTQVNTAEMKDFFSTYGTVRDVKIITYRGGLSKGYGFVYFTEDVDIKSIVEQNIVWKGKTLKMGPAIIKQRTCRTIRPPPPPRMMPVEAWMVPSQYVSCSCSCCMPSGMPRTQSTHFYNGASPYYQVYPYSQIGNMVLPQMPVNSHNMYTYQYAPTYWTAGQRAALTTENAVECGVQTMLTVL